MLLVRELRLVNGKAVDLHIAEGQALVLEGPNGSGKSVLLRTLAGLYPINAREFLYQGRELPEGGLEDYRSRVLYCGSFTQLSGDLTAEEFLAAPLRLRIYHDHRSDFPAAEFLKRWELAGKKLSVLSSGQRQLLIFLRTMTLRPELLLLDEPTSHLDQEKTLEVEGLLREWKRGGRSYLLVSHSGEQAARLGERLSFSSLLR